MSTDNKLKNNRGLIILITVIIFAVGVKLYSYHWPKAVVAIGDFELKVLVAKDYKRLYRGLGGRDDLGKYDGMLFLFPDEGQHGMVMRDMRFPIDIIWIRNGIVVDIAPNVPIEPGRAQRDLTVYFARQDSDLVLEMPAGQVLARNIKIGDRFTVGN